MTAPAETASLRCSAVIREAGVDPIGTAGCYRGYLLLEWPLPWPRDLSEVPELAPLHEALRGTGIRLQGLVPEGGATRRVVRYGTDGDDGGFRSYRRVERAVPAAGLLGAAIELLGTEVDQDAPEAPVDVLVCTHGRRDVCCGSLGTALAAELTLGGGAHVWRTSHTGGHRFAPTAVVLPQGTVWAHLDGDALERIVARRGPLDDLLPRYRGCAGLRSPEIQAVEREAFRDVGWGWLDWARRGETLEDGRTRVTGRSPSGEVRTWAAEVSVSRQVPVPECGLPVESAKKSEPELMVHDIDRSGH